MRSKETIAPARHLALAAALSLGLLSGCVTSPSTAPAIGALAGAGGSALAPKIAKSGPATAALSFACANAAPILDRYAARAFPAAAPFIPGAEAEFAQFCQGALPNGTSTTTAAARLNFAFAVLLGSGLMN